MLGLMPPEGPGLPQFYQLNHGQVGKAHERNPSVHTAGGSYALSRQTVYDGRLAGQ